MSTNPYQPPASIEDDEPRDRFSEERSYESPSAVVAPLRDTRPWVKLVSVLGFIGSALVFAVSIFMLFSDDERTPTWLALVSALSAVLYFYPSLYLWRYAKGIEEHLQRRDEPTLARALEHQRSFWKYVGALTLVFVVLYTLAIFVGVFIGVSKHSR